MLLLHFYSSKFSSKGFNIRNIRGVYHLKEIYHLLRTSCVDLLFLKHSNSSEFSMLSASPRQNKNTITVEIFAPVPQIRICNCYLNWASHTKREGSPPAFDKLAWFNKPWVKICPQVLIIWMRIVIVQAQGHFGTWRFYSTYLTAHEKPA